MRETSLIHPDQKGGFEKMQKPREITHETAHGTIVLSSPDQLIVKGPAIVWAGGHEGYWINGKKIR